MKPRIILLVLAISSLTLISFVLPLALLLRTLVYDRAVAQASAQTQLLAPLVATSDRSLRLEVARARALSPGQQVTIFLPHGQRLGFPARRTPDVLLAESGRSFTERVSGGVAILVPVQGLPSGTAVIRAFVPASQLTAGVTKYWLLLGAEAAGLLVLGVTVAAQLAKALVRPLDAVAKVSEQLADGDLSARAPADGPPEIRQVSDGLNRLAARIGELLAHERETLADLSHRLRTPLTALRIDAESLQDTEAMARVVADVDVLTRTVNEIIREARRPGSGSGPATCDAAAVIRHRATFWRALAEDQERLMSVDVPPGTLPVRVSADDLATCADILFENVFSHTDEGTPFSVRIIPRTSGGAWLSVSDAGPGFADSDVATRGRSHAGSTGLGLDIARRIAESSGGTLTLGRSPHGGAAVTIGLGPAVAPARRTRRMTGVRRRLPMRALGLPASRRSARRR